jgi:hypothetical protein
VIVENVLVGEGSVNEVAAGCVDDTLWLTGRTRSVENEQRILGVHFFAWAFGGHLDQLFVEPDVTAFLHLHIAAGVADDTDGHVASVVGERIVGVLFQRNLAAAAKPFVRRDDEFGGRTIDAAHEAVW